MAFSVSCGTSYAPSSLFNYCTQSERDVQTYEVKDKQGRVTHKFQQMDTGFAVTAYCYDDALGGRLAYVIPPEAYKKMGTGAGLISSFTESDVIFKESIYGYVYDNLNRISARHIPGAGWRYSVYDKQDFEVMFADDSDLSKGYWQFQKFDALGRKILGGIKTGIGSVSRATLQTAFDGMTTEIYEEIGTGLFGYTNRSFPSAYAIVDADIRRVIYYDNYGFNSDPAYNFQSANAFHAQGFAKGLMTGMLVRNVKTGTWQKTILYYDYRGKLIQNFHLSNLNKLIRKDYQYRFNGELLRTRIVKGSTTKLFVYEYDHISRKVKFKHSINGVLQNITSYSLDPIGRLSKKSFKGSDAVSSKQTGNWTDVSTWLSNGLPTISDIVTINSGQTITIPTGESASAGKLNDNGLLKNFGTLNFGKIGANPLYEIAYKYHIRGSLIGINTDANNNLTNSLFSYRLDYETDGILYDGNLRKQSWKSNIDNVQRDFTHSYDVASRLKNSVFTSTKAGENYALNNVNYDDNGNITNLSRNGLKSNNSFGLIDNLNYTYNANSNKILKVDDASSETASFKDVTGNDYSYWIDGSLKSDNNKSISQIDYNYLKLPQKVNFADGKWIEYEYDADGTKLKKTLSTGKVTDYEEDDIYENNILYQTTHDEGRIVNGDYQYHVNDHLGNLRVAFRDSLGIAKIVQYDNKGPWGETLEGINYARANKNHFNFSTYEEENDFGLGVFDAHARVYDPIVPHFWQIDPLAELNRKLSPTVFSNNNPLRFIDPDGMQAQSVGADGITTDQWVESKGDAEQEKAFRQENNDKDKDKKKKEEKAKNSLKIPTIDEARNSNGLNPNGDGISPDLTLEGGYIGGKILGPLFGLIGKAWGAMFGRSLGGAWITTNESMSLAAAEYQSFVTGRAANESYLLKGVKFDGLIDNVLVDAKSGYGNFVNKSTGEFQSWFRGTNSLLDQAERQISAANGTKIQWYFQNNAAMQATQNLFNKEGINGIELIFKSN